MFHQWCSCSVRSRMAFPSTYRSVDILHPSIRTYRDTRTSSCLCIDTFHCFCTNSHPSLHICQIFDTGCHGNPFRIHTKCSVVQFPVYPACGIHHYCMVAPARTCFHIHNLYRNIPLYNCKRNWVNLKNYSYRSCTVMACKDQVCRIAFLQNALRMCKINLHSLALSNRHYFYMDFQSIYYNTDNIYRSIPVDNRTWLHCPPYTYSFHCCRGRSDTSRRRYSCGLPSPRYSCRCRIGRRWPGTLLYSHKVPRHCNCWTSDNLRTDLVMINIQLKHIAHGATYC